MALKITTQKCDFFGAESVNSISIQRHCNLYLASVFTSKSTDDLRGDPVYVCCLYHSEESFALYEYDPLHVRSYILNWAP